MKIIRLSLFGTIAVTLASLNQVQSQTFLTNGLVAYYPFDGNANDASGNGNNGQVHGAQLAVDRFESPNSAYSFNGTNAFILLTNSFQLPGDWTISAWARPSTLSQEGFVIHIGRDDGTQGTANGFGIDFNHGELFGLLSGLAKWDSGLGVTNTNSWVQVLMERSGTVTKVFLNGSVGPSSWTGTSPAPIQGYIGSESEKSVFFNGEVDDVRVYDRALSTNEIQQLYQFEAGPNVALIKAVKPSFSNLTLGTNYQLQVSGDFKTWTNQGSVFLATNSAMVYPQQFEVSNFEELFFRLQVAP